MADRRLGRGLDGLMQEMEAAEPAIDGHVSVTSLPVGLLDANPYQPRQGIDVAGLEKLKASIAEHGVLQPIMVRPQGERYQVVAGERRLRAARGVGLEHVPVVVRNVPDDRMLELALIENLQREDLDPIEKAESFRAYLEGSGRTQEVAAQRLGLDRSTVSNMIRLLELPGEVQQLVRAGAVAMGHARALLALGDAKRQMEVAERVVREGLSVRQVERIASASAVAKGRKSRVKAPSPHVRELEGRLREALGTKVSVQEGKKPGTGRIFVEFYSAEELDRLLGIFEGRMTGPGEGA